MHDAPRIRRVRMAAESATLSLLRRQTIKFLQYSHPLGPVHRPYQLCIQLSLSPYPHNGSLFKFCPISLVRNECGFFFSKSKTGSLVCLSSTNSMMAYFSLNSKVWTQKVDSKLSSKFRPNKRSHLAAVMQVHTLEKQCRRLPQSLGL